MAVPEKDYPLYENYDREWDKDEAIARLKEFAEIESENPNWRLFHTFFMWYDENDPEKITSHKLPYVDIIDGKPYAIWRAIANIKARLSQTDIPEEDKKRVEQKVSRYEKMKNKEQYVVYLYADPSRIPNFPHRLSLVEPKVSNVNISTTGNSIAILGVSGVMFPETYKAIYEAAKSIPENTSTVFIEFDSQGGFVSGIDWGIAAVELLKSRGINVVAYTASEMLSAAYHIASYADKIIATPNAFVGSIGAVATAISFKQILKKSGIDVEVFRSGKFKALPTPLDDLNEESKSAVQELVEKTGSVFFESVKKNRPNVDESVFEGKAYIAEDALRLGLIDEVTTKLEFENTELASVNERYSRLKTAALFLLSNVLRRSLTDEEVTAFENDPETFVKSIQYPRPVSESIDTAKHDALVEKYLKMLGH